MLTIGICDDNEQFVVALKTLIVKYLESNHLEADIRTYITSQEFLRQIQQDNMFDLLFLDIELDGVTGIDIGKYLRMQLHDDLVQIVFVSAKTNYALQLFDIRPFNFLIKPVDYGQVKYIMDEYNRLFQFQHRCFEYQVGKQRYKIDEKAILYFESTAKKINMLTCNGKREFYGKLSEVYKNLNTCCFCKVHKSYVVNMRYISEYGKEEVIMSNGDVIPVSRSMRETFQKKIIEFEWGRDKQ